MSVLSLPRSMWTPFQEKTYELDQIKKKSLLLTGELNSIVIDYEDWFKRKHQRFLDGIKSIQFNVPTLLPNEINNLQTYRQFYDMGLMMEETGTRFEGRGLMEEYLTFWTRLLAEKAKLASFLVDVDVFCSSIKRLRHPHIKEDINSLYGKFCEQCKETFNFNNVNNERENLFTYNLNLSDQRFLGLVGFIPYILTLPTKVCYLVTKLYVEKDR